MRRAFSPLLFVILTPIAIGVHALAAKHFNDPSWIAAGGDLVIVFGAITLARSFVRLGTQRLGPHTTVIKRGKLDEQGRFISDTPEEDRQQALDSVAELVIGPALIILGTLINGYGGIIGAWWLQLPPYA